jgi:hypothetical protein
MSNEEIAALRKRIEELEAKAKPPEKKSEFVPMSDAEWIDRMHQMREGRMAMATPPSVLRDLAAAEPKGFMSGVLRDNRNAPTSPTGMIPRSEQPSNVRGSAGSGTGYVDPRPLGPQPGINWVDAQLIADDVRKRKLGE